MELYNVFVVSADRNGSTAFMESLIGPRSINGDYFVHLAEAFSQDPEKGQPHSWYQPKEFKPKDVIQSINCGTGKPVTAKFQMTWSNFNSSFFELKGKRNIFFHRNMFDATVSRCLAQKTGLWHKRKASAVSTEPSMVHVEKQFFLDRFEYRIDCYLKYIDSVLEWADEFYLYDKFDFPENISIEPNGEHKNRIKNYSELVEFGAKNERYLKLEQKLDGRFSTEFRPIQFQT